ncbi:MAG: ABC-F family ATP-binding cassette domain-containing protein [Cytophagales bacterium]
MLRIKSITHQIGGRTLYKDLGFVINPKDKIGLVGPNGSGKSTLFKIMAKEITPTAGEVLYDKGESLGFFNQELLSYQTTQSIYEVTKEAFKEALALQKKIDEVLAVVEKNPSEALLETLGDLQERFAQLDGYDMTAQVHQMLTQMGFSKNLFDHPFNSFSGGWRMRVLLAKMLLRKHQVLLLDEPTNHLDIVSIHWLEKYLKTYTKAFIVISHDRRFLDNVTQKTIALGHERMKVYAGNYSFYEREKAQQAISQQSAYENQQREIKRTKEFINRFRAKSSHARLVQSRIKQLAKIERLTPAVKEKRNLRISFPIQQQPGREIANLENIAKSFGENCILRASNAQVVRGDKIGLVGINGRGNSTLLKIIAGEMAADEGKVMLGHNVCMAFHAQHQLESLQGEHTPLQCLYDACSGAKESLIRSTLGAFLFRKDDVHKKIKVLSGGEKSRLSIAKTLVQGPNFILLDEPTNHLDIETIEILSQALKAYEGTLIIVSHDRHFIQGITNKIWYLENKQIKAYPGNYDEYSYWLKQKTEQHA